MKNKNTKEYGEYDFSNHELVVTKSDNVETYELLQKDTDGKYRRLFRVGFSYVKSTFDYTLSCFGDYGNYIFGQAISPTSDTSFQYFLEKLRYKSVQDLKGNFSQDYLTQQIDEIKEELELWTVDFDKDDDTEELNRRLEILDEIKSIDNEYELQSYIWNMTSDDRDVLFGESNYPTGKDIDDRILIIYYAFLEIGRRLENGKGDQE